MLNVAEVPFGEFLPDAPDYKNPGCVRAENVYPIAGGYGPFRGIGTAGGLATGPCRGAALFQRSTGDVVTVGGGSDRLWVDIGGTVTETTGLNDVGADGYWQFRRFGARVFAVSPTNDLHQLANIDADTTWTVLADPPAKAEVIGEVGGRLMVGRLAGNPYAVQWAALNDPLTWTANATNFNGSLEMPQTLGRVTGIAGDRFPLIFQEFGVSRIDEVGPPSVFRVGVIEEARGCIAPASIAVVGFNVFHLAHDGFCVTNGAQTTLIGTSRVNRFFLENASQGDLFRVHAAVDFPNECVVWSYIPQNGSGFTGQIIYSWAQNRWSTASLEVERLVEGQAAGTSLDDLDSTFPSLDAMDVSLDAAQFQAGERRLSAYIPQAAKFLAMIDGGTLVLDDDGPGFEYDADSETTKRYLLDGLPQEANFETGEFQPKVGHRVFANAVYPMVENADENTRAALISRELKGGLETTSTDSPVNDAGFCPVRADGRFMRARLTMPAGSDWSKAQGVQVAFRPSGAR